jgi:cytochrome c-type biogenesis protein CcmH
MEFWAPVALMVLLALVFLGWPLWRRQKLVGESRDQLVLDLFNEHLHSLEAQRAQGELDEDQFVQLKQELELSLLEDAPEAVNSGSDHSRWPLYLLLLCLPLASVIFYFERGSVEDIKILELRQRYFELQVRAGDNSVEEEAALAELVTRLEQRLEHKPDNIGNRYLLARSLMQQGLFVKAVAQYSVLVQQNDPNEVPANILSELAQAVFLAADNRITPEVVLLVERALTKDPNDTTALGLAGIASFEQSDYTAAIEHWQRAVQLMGPMSPGAGSLQAGIARARQLLAESGGAVSAPESQSNASRIDVEVSLADGLDVPADAVVFIYARAWQGPKAPLAITRLSADQLPSRVSLDESMAMAPNMTITSFPQLELVARVSLSGQPAPSSGDWQVTKGPLKLADIQAPISLVVEQQLP